MPETQLIYVRWLCDFAVIQMASVACILRIIPDVKSANQNICWVVFFFNLQVERVELTVCLLIEISSSVSVITLRF